MAKTERMSGICRLRRAAAARGDAALGCWASVAANIALEAEERIRLRKQRFIVSILQPLRQQRGAGLNFEFWRGFGVRS